MTDRAKLNVTETYTIEKFDGEYTPGAKPVETVEIEIKNGIIVDIRKKENKN